MNKKTLKDIDVNGKTSILPRRLQCSDEGWKDYR